MILDLVRDLGLKTVPTGIRDRLGKTGVLLHTLDVKMLHTDKRVFACDLDAFNILEMLTLISYMLVYLGNLNTLLLIILAFSQRAVVNRHFFLTDGLVTDNVILPLSG